MPLNPMIHNKVNDLAESARQKEILSEILKQEIYLEETGDIKNEIPVEKILDTYNDESSGDSQS